MDHRCPKDDFRFFTEQAVVALCGILEALAVGMLLAADGHMLQYLEAEDFYLPLAHTEFLQAIVGNGIERGILQRFDDEPAGFLLEEAFYAEYYSAFEREMFGDILIVLVIVLPDHAFLYEIEGTAHFTFLQDGVTLLELHGYEDTAQGLDA